MRPILLVVARQLWPDKRPDGSVSVAVRLLGPSLNLAGTVERLLESWEAEVFKTGHDLLGDLDRPPWVETMADGVEVVFEGRPGNRMWRDWLVWFTRYVDASELDVKPVAFADRVGGRVRSAMNSGPGSPSA